MKTYVRALLFLLVPIAVTVTTAQEPMPRAALEAKTVAILQDSKTGEVSDGAREQLKRWGRFTLVDDADSADIVFRFDKKTDREKHNEQSTDEAGRTTYSGSLTFSSHVHMRAYLKGSKSPFYTTETDDSKKKAGVSCVTSFEKAWLAAR
jgi:hypothetical protein